MISDTNDNLEQRIKLTMEWEVVQSLMAGNDTQCFSLEQYVAVRDQWIHNLTGLTTADLGIGESERPWHLEYARRQLRGFPAVVEVKPDVWTLRDQECHTGAHK